MIRIVKPKKPKKAKQPVTCTHCHIGKIKEWESTPYPDWDWVRCHVCQGLTVISCEDQDTINNNNYQRDLADWKRRVDAHKILKKIRITKEQLEAITRYGQKKFIEDYLGETDESG